MPENELGLFAALARHEGLNGRIVRLCRHFGNVNALYSASPAELAAAGATPHMAWEFVAARGRLNPNVELAQARRCGITLLPFTDARFPARLLTLPNPPSLLFVRGNLDALVGSPAVAAIGTRRMTSYGRAVIRQLVEPLAEAGATIVSGLALGCDAACHEAALNVGAVTVAVLGSGVDQPSVGPRANGRLAERIVDSGGALVSEYAPGAAGLKNHFPERNRVIAGLTQATIVIEAAEKSGSLITAFLALDNGRDVWAVPGPITAPTSAGCNRLIARGAFPALSAADLLDQFGLHAPGQNTPDHGLNRAEAAIVAELSGGPAGADALAESCALGPAELLSALTALEIRGVIAKIDDDYGLVARP